VQLPPSLSFEEHRAATFFEALRRLHRGDAVCEPRHPRSFSPEVEELVVRFQVAGVAADPAPAPRAGEPGGWRIRRLADLDRPVPLD
jgi:uncharacterized protein YecE (DUF72 family)